MKKKIILYIIISFVLVGLMVALYVNNSNRVIYSEEKIIVSPNTYIYDKEYKLSDIVKINDGGRIIKDYKVKYSTIGEKELLVDYIIDNQRYRDKIKIDIKDIKAPIIYQYSKNYTLLKGSDKNILNYIKAIDDYDTDVKIKLSNTYNINVSGKYKLNIEASDSSANKTVIPITVNVVDKLPKTNHINKKTKVKLLDFSEFKKKFGGSDRQLGIDVSKYQGEIDFKKLKEAGVEFVIIRLAVQKGYYKKLELDPYFKTNIENAIENNIPVGVYLYTYTSSVKEAKAQAGFVKKMLKPYKVDMYVAYDFEDWKNLYYHKWSLRNLNLVANTFLDELKDTYKVLNYSSKNYVDFWYENKHEFWVAHYNQNKDYKGQFRMWQVSSQGKVDGIKGAVDLNIHYLD